MMQEEFRNIEEFHNTENKIVKDNQKNGNMYYISIITFVYPVSKTLKYLIAVIA